MSRPRSCRAAKSRCSPSADPDGRPVGDHDRRADEGLAPKIVQQVGELLEKIAARGVSILLVEQKLTIALKISTRVYVMGHGEVVFEGTPDELKADDAVRQEWLEV